jgi:NCAIR mutase (PurE)-related protein
MLNYDSERLVRIGMPEAVLCDSKTELQVDEIIRHLAGGDAVLLTRLSAERHTRLSNEARTALDFDPVSCTAFLNGRLPDRPGVVAIVAAGTSDLPVCAEAERTLAFSGISTETHIDVGVAGLWRLERRIEQIRAADVVIVVAGMDAALVSVVGGLVAAPVIAIPTSVGYGTANGGQAALNSSLCSCAQGVAVVNIDNGFGGACAAVRALRLLARTGPG